MDKGKKAMTEAERLDAAREAYLHAIWLAMTEDGQCVDALARDLVQVAAKIFEQHGMPKLFGRAYRSP
jgi:hypothetical protein